MSLHALKCKNGKFVVVRRSKSELQLKLVDYQLRGTEVKIEVLSENDKKLLGLRFCYKDKYYSPMVNGNFLQLLKVDADVLPKSCLFEKINQESGKHYTLQSVVEPSYYLSESGDSGGSRSTVVSLSENIEESVMVTDD